MKTSYRDPREYLSFSPTSPPLRERSRMDEMQRRIDELETANAQLKAFCKKMEYENAHKQLESERKIRLCEASWDQIHSDNIQQKKCINQKNEIIANQSELLREQRMQINAMLDDVAQHREIIVTQIKTIEVQDEDIKQLKIDVDNLLDQVDSLELRDFTQQEMIISLNAQLADKNSRLNLKTVPDDKTHPSTEIIEEQKKKIKSQKEQIRQLQRQVVSLSDENDALQLIDYEQNETIISLNAQLEEKNRLIAIEKNKPKKCKDLSLVDKFMEKAEPTEPETESTTDETNINFMSYQQEPDDSVEQKLNKLTADHNQLKSDNENKEKQLQNVIAENETLKAKLGRQNTAESKPEITSANRIKILEDALASANEQLATVAATEKASAACINILEDAIAKRRAYLN